MFYLIGLGLGDAKDITVRGLEIVKKCDKVLLEAYTSILTVGHDALEKFYGRPLELADRELCESSIDEILKESKHHDIALLVVGDPLGATTHTDMLLRAKEFGVQTQIIKGPWGDNTKVVKREIAGRLIEASVDDKAGSNLYQRISLAVECGNAASLFGTQIVHNASIMNAVSCCGLQLYNFGETVSIPYWTESWKPDSFIDKIIGNYKRNLHTLCLLDIKVKEPTEESLTKKVRQYMDPKFMSVAEAASQLIQIIENKPDIGIDKKSLCVGLSRVGAPDQNISVRSLEDMQSCQIGPPLHSLVIPAPQLHPLETDYLQQFR